MTDYLPLTLKYRPRKLDDLLGQEVLTRTLANAIKAKRVRSAFLFVGPLGCGKTSAARVLAACLNSPKGETTVPEDCEATNDILEGRAVDVIEIDAASNKGIDDVREIREEARYRAGNSRYKIFIIDEVHGLTPAAFEALLKTLEEPPAFCKFILCIAGHERVLSETRGLLRIDQVLPGDRIFTEDGYSVVNNVFAKGKAKTIRIVTNRGTRLSLTPDHRVRVFDGANLIWKEAHTLQKGDRLPVLHGPRRGGGNAMSYAECELLGRIVGDGYYSHGHLGVLFNKAEDAEGRELLAAAGVRTTAVDKTSVWEHTLLDSGILRNYFGLRPYKRGGKRLPLSVYTMSTCQLEAFTKGWIDADGSESPDRRLYGSNLALLVELRTVLLAHGVVTNLRESERVFLHPSSKTGISPGVYKSHILLFAKRWPAIPCDIPTRKHLIASTPLAKRLQWVTGRTKQPYGVTREMIDDSDLIHLQKPAVYETFSHFEAGEFEDVFDLEMANSSESFVVGGLSVHNCTTEAHKVKPTILSRCQDFSFNLFKWNAIAAQLKDICVKENITIDTESLKLIAKHADGHMRDGIKHLETVQMYAGFGEPIGTTETQTALGVASDVVYFQLVDSILTKNASNGMKAVQSLLASGQTVGRNVNGLLDHLRTLLVISCCESTAGLVSLTDEEKAKYLHQRGLMKLGLIDDMISNLITIHRGLAYSVSPQVLLEQFLFKSIKTHHRLTAGGE